MKIKKRILSLALAGTLALGLVPAFSMTALADGETTSDYIVTIPSKLDVTKSGWNDAGGIKAQKAGAGVFDSSKKLVITAESENGQTNEASAWKLVSGENSVGYNLADENGINGTYNASAVVPSWEFSAGELTSSGTSKVMGIIVEDYTNKPAGDYTDTVIFTAKVEDNLVSFTLMRDVNRNSSGNYTVAPGTTWRQFIQSGNAPASLSIAGSYVMHDMNLASSFCCGGTRFANTADKKRVKPDDAIIDGATYGCSDYLRYQDHD